MSAFAELKLVADSSGLKSGVTELDRLTAAGGKAEKATDRFGREFKRTGDSAAAAGTKIKGAAASTDKMRAAAVSAAKHLVAMTTAFLGVRSIGAASEQYNKIANSMRAMGVDAGHVAGSIQAIADISNRTRAPLEATAQLYQRISIAGKDLGASQQSVMRFYRKRRPRACANRRIVGRSGWRPVATVAGHVRRHGSRRRIQQHS
ncbi:MAG: hypothetical protein IPL79_20390 [Myxococcales bacterium]|nr:hypothetical protein [Myxococcales bacterium]